MLPSEVARVQFQHMALQEAADRLTFTTSPYKHAGNAVPPPLVAPLLFHIVSERFPQATEEQIRQEFGIGSPGQNRTDFYCNVNRR